MSQIFDKSNSAIGAVQRPVRFVLYHYEGTLPAD